MRATVSALRLPTSARRNRRRRHTLRGVPTTVATVLATVLAMVLAMVPMVVAGLSAVATAAHADTLTAGNDPGRSGWYPNEAALTQQLVGGSTFGKLFSAPVNGQVYAQPLVANGHLLVATEANNLYGLDPQTGAQQWTRYLGVPWNASDDGCADLTPTMGVTGTPVVDPGTGTEYVADETYLNGVSGAPAFYLHAIDISTGADRPGYPLLISGTASNNGNDTFDAGVENLRSSLLLMNGVIYMGFGSHCDYGGWKGWVVGASTWQSGQTTAKVTTLWTSSSGPNTGVRGAGIWSGLASDGNGRILLTTGNGAIAESTPPPGQQPTPIPGNQPPPYLGMSIVRLDVQSDGSLKAGDFFTPYDAVVESNSDQDLGSGGVSVLPSAYFGTPTYPHLAVDTGKSGYLYLLNRDNLGGFDQSGGGDAVLGRTGPYGGVWGRPGVWPGDGGYVYETSSTGAATSGAGNLRAFKYGLSGSGTPTLSLAGTAPDTFGFGSSSPVITSNGTTSGSAVLWTVLDPGGNGVGAQLRAYNPVPAANGTLQMIFSAPVGTGSKFAMPGVDGNKVYVGTRDGQVIGFGSPVNNAVTASTVVYPKTIVGSTSTANELITAAEPVTVTGLSSTSSQFVVGGTYSVNGGSPHPVTANLSVPLNTGDVLSVPMTFAPVTQTAPPGNLEVPPPPAGLQGGQLDVATSAGQFSFSESGISELAQGTLYVSPPVVSLDGAVVNGPTVSTTVTISNVGATAIDVTGETLPAAPLSVSGLPATGATIAPGSAFSATVTLTPGATTGQYQGNLVIDTSAGNSTIPITAAVTPPPQMTITPESLSFGTVQPGVSVTRSFTVSNGGGAPLTISLSKPPATNVGFVATTQLAEGTTVAAGQTLTESVTFTGSTAGQYSDKWIINGNDGGGVQNVVFAATTSGTTSVVPPPTAGGWQLNGASVLSGASLQLTPAATGQAGSAFWPTPVSSANLSVAFDATLAGGGGADGMALVFADPSSGAKASSLGTAGGGLGFSGIPGTAVALDTYRNSVNPSANFIGVTNGGITPGGDLLKWIVTNSTIAGLRPGPDHIVVTVANGQLNASINGVAALGRAVTLPANVLIGFSGGTGGITDAHAVSNVVVTTGGPVSPTNPVVPAPTAPGWQFNGSTALSGTYLQLTQAHKGSQAGTAFWPTAVSSAKLSVTFDATLSGGGGADGMTVAFVDPASGARATSLGTAGGGLGFSGIAGTALALDTYKNSVNPSANFIGLTNGGVTTGADLLRWTATNSAVPTLRPGPDHVVVIIANGHLTATVNGVAGLSQAITLPPNVLIGFTGGTGGITDTHAVSNVTITVG